MEEKRCPVSVRLLGVMHKERSKLYITSVLWSNQNEVIIYRNLEDFKTLHKQLKKKYLPSNPFRNSERILPKFKAQRVMKSGQKKSISKSLLRLKPLEDYCTALLSSDERISKSPELIQFLVPRPDDLKPEFAQNSIIIVPSEDTLSRSDGGGSEAGVTQPFVTETYRCIAPYETKDTKNRSFKVEMDEVVDVLIKDKGGWWLVENDAKCIAWFPAPYLEKADMDHEDIDLDGSESVLCIVTRNYKSVNADELSVEIGSVAEVLQTSDNGWWLIRYNHKVGYVPSMYLQPYSKPQVCMIPGRAEFHGSSSFLALPQSTSAVALKLPRSEPNRSHAKPPQPPAVTLSPADRIKSRSTDVLRENRPGPAAPWAAPASEVPLSEHGRARSRTASSESSESSSGDDSGSLSDTSFNAGGTDVRRSSTPQPTPAERLNPEPADGGRLMGSTSDPNLFKSSRMPKVPPRPQAQEILKRCTTVTRKNASKNQQLQLPGVMHGR